MRIPYNDMKEEFKRILINRSFSKETAEKAAESITNISCEGVYSHGVNRFPRIIEYIDKGYIDPHAQMEKVNSFGAVEQWDGHLGPGNLNAKKSMDRAMELASEHGIGCVAVRNTNHWLRGGDYGWQAARAGFAGICWTNTLPNMPAWGATDRRIGNNPLIMALPRKNGPVVVDMAMSQFSYGKIEQYKLQDKELPVPGGFDAEGNITKDPREIEETWRVLPVGFWKGSSLSIVLDLLAALLSGGKTTKEVGDLGADEYSVSQVFIAISPEKLQNGNDMEASMNEAIENLKASNRVSDAEEIFYPGERAQYVRADNLKNGIPVDPDIWNKIKEL